jgi:DNA-binding transcriptional ArsR family regulator
MTGVDTTTVFISYSHYDKAWVHEWLLPRLEAAGLKVLIDTRDFTIGAPALVNIERAVESSQRTLLVLTPHWVASEWTNFESLLLQTGDPTGLRGRLLPLMLETCAPPQRLGIFTYADFRDPGGRDAALERLLRQITGDASPPWSANRPGLPNLVPSTLPPQPYFFGREEELASIAEAISPEARTWGALIDGPGGIGKTALAVRAGHLAPAEHFACKIFLSAKVRELTPAGEQPLQDFMLPNYMALLAELARELGEPEIAKGDPNERPNTVRRALAGKRALIVIDNLETLAEPERLRVFQFLGRLPEGNKAIVTSRKRSDVDARAIRLDRLAQTDAFALLDELAKRNRLLARASAAERQALYELTHGNPLLIQWTAGQLDRGQCRTVAQACDFLKQAPADNNPLEYIFGDLAESFSETETKALAGLAHFTQPAQVKWVADIAGLAEPAALTALEDLTDRGLVVASPDGASFLLPPLAAHFLKTRRPEAVAATAGRLTDRVYALALENGYRKYDRFPALEAEWPRIAAALPLFLAGPNERLQTLCDALRNFLDFSGRWDEWLALSEQAEAKAVAAGDWLSAGWRAYDAGSMCSLRRQTAETLRWADRAAGHWETSRAGAVARFVALQLRAMSYLWANDYNATLATLEEASALLATPNPASSDLANGLRFLADTSQSMDINAHTERLLQRNLEFARNSDDHALIACASDSLAEVAIIQKDWAKGESLAREALALAEKLNRMESVGSDCHRIATALLRQGKPADALPFARRAVEIYARLRYPYLEAARGVLGECEAGVG